MVQNTVNRRDSCYAICKMRRKTLYCVVLCIMMKFTSGNEENFWSNIGGVKNEGSSEIVQNATTAMSSEDEEQGIPPHLIGVYPVMYKWFPRHDLPPTDPPEIEEETEFTPTERDANPVKDLFQAQTHKSQHSANRSTAGQKESIQVGAFLMEHFPDMIEDGEYVSDDQQPASSPRKDRQKRATTSQSQNSQQRRPNNLRRQTPLAKRQIAQNNTKSNSKKWNNQTSKRTPWKRLNNNNIKHGLSMPKNGTRRQQTSIKTGQRNTSKSTVATRPSNQYARPRKPWNRAPTRIPVQWTPKYQTGAAQRRRNPVARPTQRTATRMSQARSPRPTQRTWSRTPATTQRTWSGRPNRTAKPQARAPKPQQQSNKFTPTQRTWSRRPSTTQRTSSRKPSRTAKPQARGPKSTQQSNKSRPIQKPWSQRSRQTAKPPTQRPKTTQQSNRSRPTQRSPRTTQRTWFRRPGPTRNPQGPQPSAVRITRRPWTRKSHPATTSTPRSRQIQGSQIRNSTSKNQRKSVIPRKTVSPNIQRNTFSRQKSSGSQMLLVVKPILDGNGATKTTTLSMPSRQYDTPQATTTESRVSYSRWSSWMACSSKTCGVRGKRMRTRSCFANDITIADYEMCTYDKLVDERSCEPLGCSTTPSTSPSRTFRWSFWSKCSVTCGSGGQQTRTKLCYKLAEDGSGATIPMDCDGVSIERRPCQYSVSCPSWNTWSAWSSCSKTCGHDGVSSRERKCIVERYMSFALSDQGTPRQFDGSPGTKPTVVNKNAVKSSQRKSPPKSRKLGLLLRGQNGEKVFIVDAPIPRHDAVPFQRPVPTFHRPKSVKEFVDVELCLEIGGYSEEERRCIRHSCPASWTAWSSWSSCTVTCGMGISRRQRSCNGGSRGSTCIGKKFAYRRCYTPPCWSSWSHWTRCSASCGGTAGQRTRTRNCLGTTYIVPEYTQCDGETSEVDKCLGEPCPGDEWGTWGPYGECDVSCNGGYRKRVRKCHASKCSGPSEDFGRCNEQQCPSWSRWSLFSCCSVSCGVGTRRRTRRCENDVAGETGCLGKSFSVEACYKPPCNVTRKQTAFGGFRCGVRSAANIKTIARVRIFGGKRSAAHSWPWQLSWQHRESLTSRWKHFCGATLIHPRWVVTASHCTEESDYHVNHRDPGDNWSVVVGMVKLYRDGTRYFVERIFIHPKYEYKSVPKNDIALLKLRKMVPVTKTVMPACMPQKMRPQPGDECYVTGWGYTTPNPNSSLSLSLREATVPVLKFGQCRNLGDYYRYFLDSTIHMCAGNPITASTDSCTGDSGGPLACGRNKRWYLGGVTSFGFVDCGTPGHVGIYAPMDTYESWIRSTINNETFEKC